MRRTCLYSDKNRWEERSLWKKGDREVFCTLSRYWHCCQLLKYCISYHKTNLCSLVYNFLNGKIQGKWKFLEGFLNQPIQRNWLLAFWNVSFQSFFSMQTYPSCTFFCTQSHTHFTKTYLCKTYFHLISKTFLNNIFKFVVIFFYWF